MVRPRLPSGSSGYERSREVAFHALKSALAKVEEALTYFGSDEHTLSLRATLLAELTPFGLKNQYSYLRTWHSVKTIPNVRLLFQLARISFILGYYEDARRFFSELESGVGIGHRLRSRPRFPIVDNKGKMMTFEGAIANVYSPYEGEIRCETLRNLRYRVAFRPIACGFSPSAGDFVSFNIFFSFRGPIALNVVKI